jgi:hypothetical protein
MHTTAKSATIESFKYRDIVFSLLAKTILQKLHLFNAGVVPNDLGFWRHPNHLIFSGMHMAAPICHTIKICPDGDFGPGLVVFNRLWADNWTRVTALDVQYRSKVN